MKNLVKTAGGKGIGPYRRGKVLTQINDVEVGQLLVVVSQKYKATNLAKVTQTFSDKFYSVFANPDNPAEKRQSSDEEFGVYQHDLDTGEYFIALEPAPGAEIAPTKATPAGVPKPEEGQTGEKAKVKEPTKSPEGEHPVSTPEKEMAKASKIAVHPTGEAPQEKKEPTILASWDSLECIQAEVAHIKEDPDKMAELKEDGVNVEDDAALFSEATESCPYDMYFEDFQNDAQAALQERKSASGVWDISGVNMGWQNRSGDKRAKIETYEDLRDKVLPKTSELTITMTAGEGNSINMRVAHHDSPTGESYTLTPVEPLVTGDKVRITNESDWAGKEVMIVSFDGNDQYDDGVMTYTVEDEEGNQLPVTDTDFESVGKTAAKKTAADTVDQVFDIPSLMETAMREIKNSGEDTGLAEVYKVADKEGWLKTAAEFFGVKEDLKEVTEAAKTIANDLNLSLTEELKPYHPEFFFENGPSGYFLLASYSTEEEASKDVVGAATRMIAAIKIKAEIKEDNIALLNSNPELIEILKSELALNLEVSDEKAAEFVQQYLEGTLIDPIAIQDINKVLSVTATASAKVLAGIYVGVDFEGPWQVFKADATPTEETHGHLYGAVIGPFKTMRGAQFMANYGKGNPHLQTVQDAEEIAKLEEAKAKTAPATTAAKTVKAFGEEPASAGEHPDANPNTVDDPDVTPYGQYTQTSPETSELTPQDIAVVTKTDGTKEEFPFDQDADDEDVDTFLTTKDISWEYWTWKGTSLKHTRPDLFEFESVPEEKGTREEEGEDLEFSDNEPSPEDIVISENGREAYYANKLIADISIKEYNSYDVGTDLLAGQVQEWMEKNKYWPTIWQAEERGGVHKIYIKKKGSVDEFQAPMEKEAIERSPVGSQDSFVNELLAGIETVKEATNFGEQGLEGGENAPPNAPNFTGVDETESNFEAREASLVVEELLNAKMILASTFEDFMGFMGDFYGIPKSASKDFEESWNEYDNKALVSAIKKNLK